MCAYACVSFLLAQGFSCLSPGFSNQHSHPFAGCQRVRGASARRAWEGLNIHMKWGLSNCCFYWIHTICPAVVTVLTAQCALTHRDKISLLEIVEGSLRNTPTSESSPWKARREKGHQTSWKHVATQILQVWNSPNLSMFSRVFGSY